MSGVLVGSIRRSLAVLCALGAVMVVGLGVLASSASAAGTHLFEGSFDGSATPAGSFSYPGRMAVDQDADVLYAIDTFNGAIVRLDVSGDPAAPVPADFSVLSSPVLDGAGSGEADETPQGGLNLGVDSDIAVDNTGGPNDGNIYVASESGFLYAFDDSGDFLYALDGTDPDGPDPLKGTPTSSLDNPCGVAVGADGSIYVSGYFTSVVRRFEPAGSSATYVSGFATSAAACHIAVDSSGAIYANHYGAEVVEYNGEGTPQGVIDPGPANAVAVATDDHVYVDRGDTIVEYDNAATQVSTFGAGKLGGSIGLAVSGAGANVFASDTFTNQVHVFGSLQNVDAPTAEIDPVADPTADSADLAGRTNPNGFETTARFEYSANGGSSWNQLTTHDSSTDPDLQSSTSDVELTDQATGLQPSTAYQARLVATNPGGQTTSDAVEFITGADAPVVETRPADLITSHSAVLGGSINARNSETTYHIEYSTDPGFAPSDTTTIPASHDVSDGNLPFVVDELVEGLDPETTYHLRLIAENSGGITIGETVTFTTRQTADQPTSCPNQQYRTGPSADLPDCRAYEQVSPVDKNGGGIKQFKHSTLVSSDGERATFASYTGFAGTTGSGGGGMTQYVASRRAQAWTTQALTPIPASDSWQVAFTGLTFLRSFAHDLTRAVVIGYDLPGGDDDISKDLNIYDLDVTTRTLRTIAKPAAGMPAPSTFNLVGGTPGVSPDGLHVVFDSSVNLVPGAGGSASKFYQWDDGQLSLAGVLPDGTVPAAGSARAAGPGGFNDSTISPDGSRALFASPPFGSSQLYMRKDATTTVRVSGSEGSTPVANPTSVTFATASADLHHVFFTTGSQLTDSDPGGAGMALYRYTDSADPEGDSNLTFIDRSVEGSGSVRVAGASDDGERVYYEGSGGMRLWDRGTVVTVTSSTVNNQRVFPGGVVPFQSRVSSDGRFIAFLDQQRQTISPNGDCADPPCGEVYLFDADGGTLTCVSCSSRVDGHKTTLEPWDPTTNGPLSFDFPRAQLFLLDDGRVFFSTDTPLEEGDVNGLHDAYQYDPVTGERMLLSTGKGGESAWFADSSADGDDVFVLTRHKLTASDSDTQVDLYDARVLGGLPVRKDDSACPAFQCEEDSTVPAAPRAGSLDLDGADQAGTRRFTLARVGARQRRAFARSGRLVLRVRVPRAGRIRIRSNHSDGASVRVDGPVTRRIAIRLDRSGRRQLRERGRLRVRIVVSFGGDKRTASVVLRSAK